MKQYKTGNKDEARNYLNQLLIRFRIKMFTTNDLEIVTACQQQFSLRVLIVIIDCQSNYETRVIRLPF